MALVDHEVVVREVRVVRFHVTCSRCGWLGEYAREGAALDGVVRHRHEVSMRERDDRGD